MKYMYTIRIFLCSVSCIIFSSELFAQYFPIEISDPKHRSESLWASIDQLAIRKQILQQTNIPAADLDLFMMFLSYQYAEEQSQFFKAAESGIITASTIDTYVASLTQKYIDTYPLFLSNKTQFSQKQRAQNNLPLAINGPCTNVDFESGTTAGWEVFTGKACQQVTPCSLVNGFVSTRHQIMTTAMVDPYIPTLPVVAPGGNFSFRLENYVNGGNAAMIQQTFLVTPTNNIFTYRYAAVLEDPGDHADSERPYFKVRMYDTKGKEIPCATYTAIAKPPIQNFVRTQVPNPNFDPTRNDGGNNNSTLDLYYRDWTTVTIPLLGLEGQNVTIQFIASDCSRGGHLGYAYIDAKCSYLNPQIPPTICKSENVTLYGPDDFAAYLWSGPGIVGSNSTQNITANKSGKYTLKLTPIADKPCPVTISTTVPERCVPDPISADLCETAKGSLLTKAVNLTKYNIPITAYNALGTVVTWHSGKPATNANRIQNPASIDIANGKKFYAVIRYSTVGSDTAEINFKVNTSPVITFSTVSPFCEGGVAGDISSSVSPSGGIFKGNSISSAGVFLPAVPGTYPITYVFTNAVGCTDSIKKSIVVNKLPNIFAGADQKVCTTSSGFKLQATATDYASISWSGGAGVFSANQSLATNYTPTATEKDGGSITLTATAIGKAPCANKSDDIRIDLIKPPSVNAGIDQDLCLDKAASVSLIGSGALSNSYTWGGGKGTFTSLNSFVTDYKPSADELKAGTITLKLTAAGNAPCISTSDLVLIHIHGLPKADAGPDRVVCEDAALQFSIPQVAGNTYQWYSPSGTVISNTYEASVTADKDSIVVVRATDAIGCIGRDTVLIEAHKPPVFNIRGPYCFKDEVFIQSNPTIFQPVDDKPVWKKDGVELTGQTEYGLLVTEEGEYSIHYTHGACMVSALTDVFKEPLLETPDAFTACEELEITVITTDIPNATYVWESEGVALPGNAFTNKIKSTTGSHQYKIQVTNQNQCKAIDSFLIIGIPNPIIAFNDTSVCGNQEFILDGRPENNAALTSYPLAYEWKYNNVVQSTTDKYYTVTQAGTYALTVSIGNCIGSDKMDVVVNPIPEVYLEPSFKFCPDNDVITLDAGSAYSYNWAPGGEVSQTIKVKREGDYTIVVTNAFNCSNSATTHVSELCPPRLFIADAFSPNRDGTNDTFNVYGIHIGAFKLLIFNRWGEVIFESKDKDYAWDGIYKGELMPIGVYPWVVTYQGDSQEYIGPYKMEGSVTIVR